MSPNDKAPGDKPLSEMTLLNTEDFQNLINGSRDTIRILDGSFSMPGALPTAKDVFDQIHIPGAQYFDIDEAADKSSYLPHMLPDEETFAEYVERLGISNDDHVIIYGQNNIAMGPSRVYWMFDIFGHEKLSIYNGSLAYWEQQGLPVSIDSASTPEKGNYKASLDTSRVINLNELKTIVETSNTNILDARPPNRFNGDIEEPRAELQSGHMPGAMNLPVIALVDQQTGGFIAEPKLSQTIQALHIDASKDIVTTCGSGVTACALEIALRHTGHEKVRVYDGSWSEYGRTASNTKVVKI